MTGSSPSGSWLPGFTKMKAHVSMIMFCFQFVRRLKAAVSVLGYQSWPYRKPFLMSSLNLLYLPRFELSRNAVARLCSWASFFSLMRLSPVRFASRICLSQASFLNTPGSCLIDPPLCSITSTMFWNCSIYHICRCSSVSPLDTGIETTLRLVKGM
jgi:hypothetical protein